MCSGLLCVQQAGFERRVDSASRRRDIEPFATQVRLRGLPSRLEGVLEALDGGIAARAASSNRWFNRSTGWPPKAPRRRTKAPRARGPPDRLRRGCAVFQRLPNPREDRRRHGLSASTATSMSELARASLRAWDPKRIDLGGRTLQTVQHRLSACVEVSWIRHGFIIAQAGPVRLVAPSVCPPRSGAARRRGSGACSLS